MNNKYIHVIKENESLFLKHVCTFYQARRAYLLGYIFVFFATDTFGTCVHTRG